MRIPNQFERLKLAALAPPKPQSWFEFEFEEPEPEVPAGGAWCEACKFDTDTCDKSEACLKMHTWSKQRNAWRLRYDRAHDAAWRLAWADALIERAINHEFTPTNDTGAGDSRAL